MARTSTSKSPGSARRPRSRRLLVLGAIAAAGASTAAYRRFSAASQAEKSLPSYDHDVSELGWGAIEEPAVGNVATPDGANLAVWDAGSGPTVVLPHCWGCSHAIWVPVARRLVESGHRVILYDQRGHGASSRGTAPLTIATLADDLAAVLIDRDVTDAVLSGHSMGGMTVMGFATYRQAVLNERVRALVLVATAAAHVNAAAKQSSKVTAAFLGSPVITRALRTTNGYRFVRGTFGLNPVRAQMELTADTFAACNPAVRAGFFLGMSEMNLLISEPAISSISVPTTVMVGSRDRLTIPHRAWEIVNEIEGARLVTLDKRGHMLPLEDPDAVTDEIIRAVKG